MWILLRFVLKTESKWGKTQMKLSDFIAAGVVCAGIVCIESVREQLNFKVTRYKIHTSKMPHEGRAKKIVFLSDLHNCKYGRNNSRLLQAVKNADPDLILIGGDMLIGKPYNLPKQAFDFVKQLPKIAPVYYANGNHEQRMKIQTEKYGNVLHVYQKELKKAGVHFLENESEIISMDGLVLRLTGLELPMETYEKFKQYHLRKADIVRQVGNVSEDKSCYELLLAHNPVYFDAYKAWGADLVLSGHLHGGIVRIPGWRGVITPQAFLFPKYSGEMTEEDGHTIVVSKGLGIHTIPFRLFNIPELVVLEIDGKIPYNAKEQG